MTELTRMRQINIIKQQMLVIIERMDTIEDLGLSETELSRLVDYMLLKDELLALGEHLQNMREAK